MKYFTLITSILNYLIFAWDIENDRDFYTWLWLLTSIVYFCFSIKYGLLEWKKKNQK